jgi:flagellar biosynthetic protein FliP
MIPVLLGAGGLADGVLQVTVDGGGSGALRFFFLLTALTFLPAALLAMTSFTRIVIVLSLLRQALGTPQLPPNQVVVGLSLFLTLFTMSPTLSKVWDEGLSPYLDDQISLPEAMSRSAGPMRTFMLRYTREEDLLLFYDVSGRPRPQAADAIPLSVLVPAYMVSELTTAFRMALFLFVPLVVIDLVLAALLMSLGMMMVPPVLVSLPLKIGIFLLADGWHLVLASLAGSF